MHNLTQKTCFLCKILTQVHATSSTNLREIQMRQILAQETEQEKKLRKKSRHTRKFKDIVATCLMVYTSLPVAVNCR